MANKNTGKILISLIIGAVVAYYAYDTYSKQQQKIIEQNQLIKVMQQRDEILAKQTFEYFVPVKDLPVGATVTVMDIKSKKTNQKQENAIISQNNIVGSVLVKTVKEGQIFVNSDFVNTSENKKHVLREGYRALTVSTEELDGLAVEMQEGVLIDIFSKSNSDEKILSKIKILSLTPAKVETVVDKTVDAVSNAKEEKAPISIIQAKTVTFEIPINKVQDFVEIYASGKAMLVMRPIGDDTVIKYKKENTKQTSSSQNVNYNSAKLPSLPVVQTYEDPSINELPAPIKMNSSNQSIEIIEANNKTQINF